MAGKFELYRDKAGEFRFRLKSANGEIILVSDGYKQKSSALNGIESVRKNAGHESRFERRETDGGKPSFILKASNGQVIGMSEAYVSAAKREQMISSVMKNARDSQITSLETQRVLDTSLEKYREELERLAKR